ncbi:competence CoiA-like predicted nuclease [Xanthomonas sp. 3272]|uniref:competence protein CoiA family protein n=1 Tax=Xanthomonas arboricola TaxID=56448 RepID=UPI001431B6C9|nr:competence protein CoiA family protein [Xanthomonas arboricola]NJC02623.1 competence CoiA-like predicted nuclease [Xanthomonas arboricola]
MKYALVEGQRAEPSPGLRGRCQACDGHTVSKCGRFLVWHWSHLPGAECRDRWAEAETEWHRGWKNRFPNEWQEIACFDSALTECHIADVKTSADLVIEFQRSSIHPDEVAARERFHKKMVWVIDGMRNDFDRFNFSNMRSCVDNDGLVDFQWFGKSKLFHRWHTTKPVFVDFGKEHGFWRILRFDPVTKLGRAGIVDKDAFVELASSGTTDFSAAGGPASHS